MNEIKESVEVTIHDDHVGIRSHDAVEVFKAAVDILERQQRIVTEQESKDLAPNQHPDFIGSLSEGMVYLAIDDEDVYCVIYQLSLYFS